MAEHKIAKERFQPAHILDAEAEKINRPSLTFMQDSWLRIRKNRAALVSLIVLALVIIMAIVGPYMSQILAQIMILIDKSLKMLVCHQKYKALKICRFGMAISLLVGKM